MNSGSSPRPLIRLGGTDNATIVHQVVNKHGIHVEAARVVITPNLISVGCADITPEAARLLLQRWEEHFGKQSIILQYGAQ